MCKISDNEFSNYELHGPTLSSYVFRKVRRKWFCSRALEITRSMLEASHCNSDAAPLFSIEVFDHDAQSSLGSCACHDIEEGMAGIPRFHFAVKAIINCSPRKETNTRLNCALLDRE